MMRLIKGLAAVAFGLSALAGTAHAQINPFYNSQPGAGLHKGDLEAMKKAAGPLFSNPSVFNGDAESWYNPRSGNKGTLTVVEQFEKNGLPCRKIKYDVIMRTKAGGRTYLLDWCKGPGGQWKIP